MKYKMPNCILRCLIFQALKVEVSFEYQFEQIKNLPPPLRTL